MSQAKRLSAWLGVAVAAISIGCTPSVRYFTPDGHWIDMDAVFREESKWSDAERRKCAPTGCVHFSDDFGLENDVSYAIWVAGTEASIHWTVDVYKPHHRRLRLSDPVAAEFQAAIKEYERLVERRPKDCASYWTDLPQFFLIEIRAGRQFNYHHDHGCLSNDADLEAKLHAVEIQLHQLALALIPEN